MKEGVLLRPVHGMENLPDPLRRGLPPHLDLFRVRHQLVGQPAHAIGHRGGEEERLPVVRRMAHDFLHVVDEPHVEHAIRLVEHEDFDAGQVRVPALEVVEQPAGRGDEHIAPEGEFVLFGTQRRAAVDDDRLDGGGPAVGRDCGGDLLREFARRRDDEASRRGGVLRVREPLHGREREGRGLPGARVSGAEHIAAGEDGGDRLALDLGGLDVSRPRHRLDEIGRKTQFAEGVPLLTHRRRVS